MTIHRAKPARRRLYGLAILTWIALCIAPAPGAWADETTAKGTVILTLVEPLMDGALTDKYKTYIMRARRRDGGKDAVEFQYYTPSYGTASPNDLAPMGGVGEVFVQDLSPGDWELYSYEFDTDGSNMLQWRPAKEFSIPFTIKPGRAVYIGDFAPVGHMVRAFIDFVGGARFIVKDQSARDIPIAKAKDPGLGQVDVSIFDVDSLHHPLLGTKNPQTEPGDDQYCRHVAILGCVMRPI
jgi:hypothetical protein